MLVVHRAAVEYKEQAGLGTSFLIIKRISPPCLSGLQYKSVAVQGRLECRPSFGSFVRSCVLEQSTLEALKCWYRSHLGLFISWLIYGVVSSVGGWYALWVGSLQGELVWD